MTDGNKTTIFGAKMTYWASHARMHARILSPSPSSTHSLFSDLHSPIFSTVLYLDSSSSSPPKDDANENVVEIKSREKKNTHVRTHYIRIGHRSAFRREISLTSICWWCCFCCLHTDIQCIFPFRSCFVLILLCYFFFVSPLFGLSSRTIFECHKFHSSSHTPNPQ